MIYTWLTLGHTSLDVEPNFGGRGGGIALLYYKWARLELY